MQRVAAVKRLPCSFRGFRVSLPLGRALAVVVPVLLLIIVDLTLFARGRLEPDSDAGSRSLADLLAEHHPEPEPHPDEHISAPTIPLLREYARTVRQGETLLALLAEQPLTHNEALAASRAMGAYLDPRRLRPGHQLLFRYREDDPYTVHSIGVRLSAERRIEIERSEDGTFDATEIVMPLTPIPVVIRGEIRGSLYASGMSAGLDPNLLHTLIQLYSFDVDFQRDVRSGDQFAVLFEEYYDEQGNWVRSGAMLATDLVLHDRTLRMYRFNSDEGPDYFDAEGNTIRKTLLRTPIEGGRLTSGFGHRAHPILGYSHLHPGLDFAAPIGTPINAAGDGVVEAVRNTSGFGIHVILRHTNGFRTLYAHMRSAARGIRSGVRVNQGQVIGYVGMTGLTTGPHLHYEVHLNGRPINPATIEFPPGRTLRGNELERFHQNRRNLERILLGPHLGDDT
ncbi:MAG: M23 family metallopeptidase [Spirochaetaceae bacterium]|nr:MAG: M23 family metallopeptidase [Spirochaetaceae bacterium]